VPQRAASELAAILPPTSARIGVIGVPLDENSSYMRGPALAPPVIRAALHSDSANSATEGRV